MFLKDKYVSDIALKISEDISKAQYKLNDIWYDAEIVSKNIKDDCLIADIACAYDNKGTVQGIRFIDPSGTVIAENNDKIFKDSGNRLLFRIKIKITERSVS
ncbi:MAG: hypothetical protein ACI4I9_04590 [Porcipelethomonas sp.]